MKWLKYGALGFFLFVLFLAIALVIVVRFVPDTEFIKTTLRDKFREATGQELTVGSVNVGVSFPQLISLNLQRVSATSREGAKIFSLDRLDVNPSVLSLLRREIAVQSLTIEGLRASVERGADGTIRNPLVLTPVPVQEGQGGPAQIPPAGGPSEQGMRFSIGSVRLVNARVDWIDHHAPRDTQAVIPVTQIQGVLTQRKPGRSFSLNLSAVVGDERTRTIPVTLDGQLTLTSDLAKVEAAAITVSSPSVALDPFQAYLPWWATFAQEITLGQTNCQINWTMGRPAPYSFRTQVLTPAGETAQLNFQGEVLTSDDLTQVLEVRTQIETQLLPLRLIKGLLPANFPVHAAAGTVDAKVTGDWARQRSAGLQGTLFLTNPQLANLLPGISPQVQVRFRAKFDPETFTLEQLEIGGPPPWGSISGKVSGLSSGEPVIDLSGRVTVDPQWMRKYLNGLPRDFRIGGRFPVAGRVAGRLDQLTVDLTADLSGVELQWSPYVWKEPSAKATLAVKGSISTPARGSAKSSALQVQANLAGASVTVRPKGPKLEHCSLGASGKVVFRGKVADLQDLALFVRRELGGKELITAKLNSLALGASPGKLDGVITVLLDRETLALIGAELPPNVTITGETHVRAGFAGVPHALNWTVEAPLNSLGVSVEKAFGKAVGVPGSLKGAGKWSAERITLDNAVLTLPGTSATAQGTLRDQNGNFGGLTIDLRKSDVKDLGKLIIPLSEFKLSGPVDAVVQLKPAGKGVAHTATVRLAGVDFRPDHAGWGIENLHGTVEAAGDSVKTAGLTGRLFGSVEGALHCRGDLQNVGAQDRLQGRLTLELGKGKILLEKMKKPIQSVQQLAGTLFDPKLAEKRADVVEFDTLTTDIQVESGVARTENLRLRGPDLKAGMIGTFLLQKSQLDLLVGLNTVIMAPNVMAYPVVQEVAKKNQELIKNVDKELKKFGLSLPSIAPPDTDAKVVRTPVYVVVKVLGSASSPTVTPVFEQTEDRNRWARLKALVN